MKQYFCIIIMFAMMFYENKLQAVAATGSPANKTISLGVDNLFKFSITASSVSWSDLSPDVGTYDTSAAVIMVIKNNNPAVNWYLSVYAGGNFVSASNPALTFSIDHLSCKLNRNSTYQTIGLTAESLANGTIGELTRRVDYRLNVDWDIQSANDYQTTVYYVCSDAP